MLKKKNMISNLNCFEKEKPRPEGGEFTNIGEIKYSLFF
jgi:hypothetical protein